MNGLSTFAVSVTSTGAERARNSTRNCPSVSMPIAPSLPKAEKKPEIWGGEQTNDFAYVKDIAEANYKALTATWENWNEVYNIGTGVEISTADAAKMVCEAVGYKGNIAVTSRRDVDPARFVYDISKARHMLDYEPRWSFKDGLKDMVEELK